MVTREIGDVVMLEKPQRIDLSPVNYFIFPAYLKGEVIANGYAKETYMVKFELLNNICLVIQVPANDLVCVV
jgi:hypothetical protein